MNNFTTGLIIWLAFGAVLAWRNIRHHTDPIITATDLFITFAFIIAGPLGWILIIGVWFDCDIIKMKNILKKKDKPWLNDSQYATALAIVFIISIIILIVYRGSIFSH